LTSERMCLVVTSTTRSFSTWCASRLVEIGEALGALPDEVLSAEPDIPLRHKLAHQYFDRALGIVAATVADDLPVLEAAIVRCKLVPMTPSESGLA
jgi:uncharacterized protein with HEPN domain